ncbi:hypothetical protein [Paenibacillus abyssi]|uniref:Sporulation membrane protein YtrI C-terminal domain-containing protein n=1 Tax=Paenibacillus abyssi TaxID=1340531 RepID=A0A917G7I1_9BACL|nr:hypothetical protein [Paenibacillus abyssi]GGG26493.1 hypothetical protein GCM10010916_48610 [Paenibacillus abyssi]
MRVPQFERFRRTLQSAGVFLLGLIAGAVLFNSLYQFQLDALHDTIEELESRMEEKDRDNKKLTEFKDQHTVIKTIHPYIEENRAGRSSSAAGLDARVEAELKERIKNDLDGFTGRSIYEIGSDSWLARKLLDQKIYTNVYERDYQIHVKTMLIVDTALHVWVEAKVHNRL